MIPRFRPQSPCGTRWTFFAALCLGLVGCQKTTVIEEDASNSPGNHYVHFRVADSASVPDSLWYRSAQDSGTEKFSVSPDGKALRASLFPFLHQIGDRDSMAIHSYRLGIHLGTYFVKEVNYMELGTNRASMTSADSLGVVLLRLADSLHRLDTLSRKTSDTSKASRRNGLWKEVATLIYQGHPKTAAYRRVAPQGLDTAKVNRQILTLASGSVLTLGESVRQWNLGMDYPAARKALFSLGLDSVKSNPFALEIPWNLGTLHIGEPAIGLKGILSGRKGIQSLQVTIQTDSGDRSTRFILSDLPDLKNNPSRLELDGRPAIAPRSAIPTGSYTLQILATDSVGNQQTYLVPFRVDGPLDHQGPLIQWRSPPASQVRNFADSLIAVRVEATDTAGIAQVTIGDSTARDSSGIWCATWVVPVSELGSALRVRAKDKYGNQTDSVLTISRRARPEPEAPSLELVRPTAGTLVPNEDDSTEIVWRGTLAAGTVNAVWIEDRPAHKGSDGLWSLKVSLPATGKTVVVPVRAQGSNGLESRNFAQIGRHRDTLGPAIVWDAPVQDAKFPYSTAITYVSLKATDPSGIDSARIGGSLAKKVGDTWKADVLLGSPGSTARIAVSVWDSAGNRTDSVIRLARADLPSDLVPEFRLVSPGRKAGVHVPWDSASVWIRWVVTDLSGIDSTSVRINSQPALRENDSTWALRVPLAPLARLYIPITATNRKGNAQAEVVEITRDGEPTFPKISRSLGLKDTVLFNDTAIELSWTISDNALESVRIAGTNVQGTAGNTYSRQVPLKPGLQWLHLEATDSSKNTTQDSIRVLSLPGMKRVEGGITQPVFLYPDTHSRASTRCLIPTAYYDSIEGRFIQPEPQCDTTYQLLQITAGEIVSVSSHFILDHQVSLNEFQQVRLITHKPNQSTITPADSISWFDAILFCNKISGIFNLTPAYDISNPDSALWKLIQGANGFRLPTFGELKISSITDSGSEWTHEWVLTNIHYSGTLLDPLGPPTGVTKMLATMPAVTLPGLGLAPNTRKKGVGFRMILPAKPWISP
ncbi:MAG: hypothetical protein IPK50_12155 [Fibrobacterota bacterium]|nr:MAG: hypothetical protein IPK50_12155 [Fibrobacterota bacterium]